jgi:membrane protein CcdC involved in cytochrome C biogenesis
MLEILFNVYAWSVVILFLISVGFYSRIVMMRVKANIRNGDHSNINIAWLYFTTFALIVIISLFPILNTIMLYRFIFEGVYTTYEIFINQFTVSNK